MAKKASAKADKPKATKPKTKKSKGAASGKRNASKSSAKAGRPSSKAGNAADALLRLAEHPLVADLIAVGATAAVAAIVKSKSGPASKAGSTRAVKDAGKAAAAAIGARLVGEFKAVKSAAESAKPAKSAKA